MISIICPFYNSENHITRTCKSIYSQKNFNSKIEVIYIDDGSTDKSLTLVHDEIVNNKNDKIHSKVIATKHRGPGHARNIGIISAKYDYISFLDSDDIWYSDKISILESEIIENPRYNLFVHDENYIRLNGDSKTITHGLFHGALPSFLYKRNILSTSAVTIEKALIINQGFFDECLQSSQDYELWLRLSKNLKIFKINRVLGEYREHEGSITSKYYLYRFIDQVKIATRYRHYVTVRTYIYKLLKIILSKQWVYGLKGILTGTKSHNH